MPRNKIPLKDILERGKADTPQGAFGWSEFVALAQAEKRPSYKSLAIMFGRTDKTIKAWLKRYDEGER